MGIDDRVAEGALDGRGIIDHIERAEHERLARIWEECAALITPGMGPVATLRAFQQDHYEHTRAEAAEASGLAAKIRAARTAQTD